MLDETLSLKMLPSFAIMFMVGNFSPEVSEYVQNC
jgi:hypothetical protein